MTPLTEARDRMLASLRDRGITDQRVLDAMAAVPRERFVPAGLVEHAYDTSALPIAGGQTISEPGVVAAMAAALGLRGPERVLEVGSGSGYAAAVLGHLAAEVIGLEIRDDLAAPARAVLAELGLDHVTIRTTDGTPGAPDRAPFDAISVAAMAQGVIPPALIDQLAPDGVLVAPVGEGRHGALVRHHHGRQESLMAVGFVPLISGQD
jgi:protein-L-isoaspartate(D-aspartate) O-methyltransferase